MGTPDGMGYCYIRNFASRTHRLVPVRAGITAQETESEKNWIGTFHLFGLSNFCDRFAYDILECHLI